MISKTISVLGCGWLGTPLAKRLITEGCSVKGSTTSEANLALLEAQHIQPYQVDCNPNLMGEHLSDFFQADALFLNIPFRRHLKDPYFYQQQIDAVLEYVEQSSIQHVIFTSSTSIYDPLKANAHEDNVIVPHNQRAGVLLAIEQTLLNHPAFKATIIRFSGLYGEERHIGRFMAGRKGVADADSPVNLIHLDDCVEIVIEVLKQGVVQDIFNACSDEHPSKKVLYTKAAYQYGLEPPEFLDETATACKIVSNDKLKRMLNYQFKYPDPLTFLDQYE